MTPEDIREAEEGLYRHTKSFMKARWKAHGGRISRKALIGAVLGKSRHRTEFFPSIYQAIMNRVIDRLMSDMVIYEDDELMLIYVSQSKHGVRYAGDPISAAREIIIAMFINLNKRSREKGWNRYQTSKRALIPFIVRRRRTFTDEMIRGIIDDMLHEGILWSERPDGKSFSIIVPGEDYFANQYLGDDGMISLITEDHYAHPTYFQRAQESIEKLQQKQINTHTTHTNTHEKSSEEG